MTAHERLARIEKALRALYALHDCTSTPEDPECAICRLNDEMEER